MSSSKVDFSQAADLCAAQFRSPGAICSSTLTGISGLAIFIIACMAIAGSIAPSAAGYSILGLASFNLLMSTASTCSSDQSGFAKLIKIIASVAMSALIITLSILAAQGVISGAALGWVVVGPIVGILGLVCLCSPYYSSSAAAAAKA